jgi:hypothetical protein
VTVEATHPRTADPRAPTAQRERTLRMSRAHRDARGQVRVPWTAQRGAFSFKLSPRELESRNYHRLPQRLRAHAPHERPHMTPADPDALGHHLATQHPLLAIGLVLVGG